MAFGQLMDAYRGMGEIDKAFWAMSQRDSINYEIRNNKSQLEITQLLKQIELEKSLIEEEKTQLTELLDIRHNIIIVIAFFVILLLLTTIFLMWRHGRERKKNLEDMKRLNKEVVEYSDRLLELNDTKNKILSVISHDLRAPFAHLLTYLSFGSEGLTDEKQDQLNKDLIKNTQNGLFMLDNLLHWANSQNQEGMIVDSKLFNLKLLVQEIINQLNDTTNTKNIDILNKCQNVNIITDEVLFQIILRNLMSNALKFSPSKSAIEVTSSKFENEVNISVTDYGKGISESVITSLKESKGKISPGVGTDGERGAGLGLKLCMNFVTLINGSLDLEVNSKGGTTATLKIPIDPRVE